MDNLLERATTRGSSSDSAVCSALGRQCARFIREELLSIRSTLSSDGLGCAQQFPLPFRLVLAQRIRDCHKLFASSSQLGEWQSPPMAQSVGSPTSHRQHTLSALGYDYKRHVHLDALAYEAAFTQEYLPSFASTHIARVTSSGMSALTTAAHYVARRADCSLPVGFSPGTYHESQFVLSQIFGSRAVAADPLLGQENGPYAALFLEPVTNSRRSETAHLDAFFANAPRLLAPGGVIVVDDTMLGDSQSLFQLAERHSLLDRVIVIQSLAKLHQAGLDLVTGGVMLYPAQFEGAPFGPATLRTHLGTHMSDQCAATLPGPDRELMQLRLGRIHRNVNLLTDTLSSLHSLDARSILSGISHPSLSAEGSLPYEPWGIGFKGGCVNLAIHAHGSEPRLCKEVIARALEAAEERQVPLVAGTSFGFDCTRICLVESNLPGFQPFLRVSPGTETEAEMDAVLAVITKALTESAH